MISGPVLVQVLEGENAIAEEPRADGRDRSQEGCERNDPRGLRRSHRCQRGARLRRARDCAQRNRVLLPRKDDLQPLNASHGTSTCSTSTRGLGGVLRAAGREALSRAPGPALGAPARRGRFRAMTRSREGAARRAGRERRASRRRRCCRRHDRRRRHAQVAARGRTAATRSRRCSFRRASRGTLCVSSQAGCVLDCAFCSTGKQGFNRNLTTAEIIGQLWLAEHTAPTPALARATRRRHQRRDDGHGRAAAELRQRDPGAAADARRQCLRPFAPAGDGVAPPAWCPGSTGCATSARWRSPSRCMRRTTRCATGWCRSTASTRSPSWSGVQPLPRKGAARLHHLRVRHARWRKRQRPPTRASWSRWRAKVRMQVQPDSVQSVSTLGIQALFPRADPRLSQTSSRAPA